MSHHSSIYERVNMNQNLPLKIIYLDSEGDETEHFIPPHWHRSIEMSLVLNGAMRLHLKEKVTCIHQNEFLLINSSEIHSVSSYPNMPCEILVLIISYDYLKTLYPNIDQLKFDIHQTDSHKDRLRELFYNINTIKDQIAPFDYMMIHSYLLEILHILFKYYLADTNQLPYERENRYQERAKEILTYIHAHYQEPLVLNDVATYFHMSSEHFSRLFHKIYHITYKSYLTRYRLYCAYQDIISTNKSLQSIALLHGFSNVKSFITHFKQTYHTTPSQYRKTFQNINK